jgi:hypothetical protein
VRGKERKMGEEKGTSKAPVKTGKESRMKEPYGAKKGAERKRGQNSSDPFFHPIGGRNHFGRFLHFRREGDCAVDKDKTEKRKQREEELETLSIDDLLNIPPYQKGKVTGIKMDSSNASQLSKSDIIAAILKHEGLW